MKIYISGKITGLDINEVIQKFNSKENKLIQQGFEVVNPIKLCNENYSESREFYLKQDIIALLDCDTIYMMKDWRESKGAILELNIAKELNIKIIFE